MGSKARGTAFFAYPGRPPEIVQTINGAITKHNTANHSIGLEPWEANDIVGVPITRPIFEKIEDGIYVAADVTFLNDNVTFETGYAIGKRKRCLLFRNRALEGDRELATRVGIFDTLGYETYATSDELAKYLVRRTNFDPLALSQTFNRKAPVYIVEPPVRSEAFGILISRVKKARWMYRSFSPTEEVRLSAMDAIRHVSQSAGVIVTLLSEGAVGQREHNLRSMFVGGLAMGMGIPTLVLQSIEYQAPLDVRDLVKKYRDPADIKHHVQEFSLEVTEYLQTGEEAIEAPDGILTTLRVGDPTAENEMTTLSQYYLVTDDYSRALRGEANLVVGRKGSGKTALFVQLRNTKRKDPQNIIIDLKPEGYQLIKLKERVLDFLTEGAQQHLITAFWEYLLLLEVAYKVLEKDKKTHMRDHRLTELYQELSSIYGTTDFIGEGDFSERLLRLSDALAQEYESLSSGQGWAASGDGIINLTGEQITEIVYKHDIKALADCLGRYLRHKGEVWLLFDNIDKGWSVDGVSTTDIFVLGCLINASRKLERELRKRDVECHSIVFVRDDVYSLLMQGSADYGKEMRVSLDWPDKDLLGRVLLKRIANSLDLNGNQLEAIWAQVAVSHYSGERALDYMIERSLMRPRNLLKIFRNSLGYAINMGHDRIEVEDIERGLKAYSRDLITEVDRELTDVFPDARRLIYEFSEEQTEFTADEISLLFQIGGLKAEQVDHALDLLLYYGVLGIKRATDEPIYVYDLGYDLEALRVRIRKWGHGLVYVLNPSLWPALQVREYEALPIN